MSFSMRNFIKNGFLKAVGKMGDYWIILNAAGWLDKGVLLEEDLIEIQSALDARNAAALADSVAPAESDSGDASPADSGADSASGSGDASLTDSNADSASGSGDGTPADSASGAENSPD